MFHFTYMIHRSFLPVTEDFSCPFCLVRCGSFKVKTKAEFLFVLFSIHLSLIAALCGQAGDVLTCYAYDKSTHPFVV